MFTLLALFCVVVVLSLIGVVIAIAFEIAPALIVLLLMPVLDYFVLKLIFRKRK